MAKPAGFQMCLPSMRKTNFEPMAMTPASACSQASSARSSRLSDSPVISGERGSNSGSLNQRVQSAWVASALDDRERAVERPCAEVEPADVVERGGSRARRSGSGAHRTRTGCEQTLEHARLLSAPGRALMERQSDALWAGRGRDCDHTAELSRLCGARCGWRICPYAGHRDGAPRPLAGEGWGGCGLTNRLCLPPPHPSPASGGGDAVARRAERYSAACMSGASRKPPDCRRHSAA